MTILANPKALIVDDEADLCRLMQMTLARMKIDCDIAYSLEMAYDFFENHDYDFCLTDLGLPDGTGIDLVKKVVGSGKLTPIAVITAHGTEDLSIEAMKLGAFDFVNKPVDLTRVRSLASQALKVAQELKLNAHRQQATNQVSPYDAMLAERLIGTSTPINELRATIKKVARSQAPVFLWGASGTGKEVVAKLIHDLSPRRDGNFVPVNCGAIPSELMESEFFGHKKGSFTGATGDKIGLFQQANGGTLFLDEVADLPLAMQVKLLRAIQEKTVRAIGDTKEIPVDIRILSATHKDLNKLVQAGQFRQDLFYRINVIMVKLPTLNDRREDIGLLANHFLGLIAKDWGMKVPTLSDEALATLKRHDFAGNVRELRNLLERAVTMCDGNKISTQHLFVNQKQLAQSQASSPYQDHLSYQTNVSIQPVAPSGVKVSYSGSGLPPVKPLIEDESEFLLDKKTETTPLPPAPAPAPAPVKSEKVVELGVKTQSSFVFDSAKQTEIKEKEFVEDVELPKLNLNNYNLNLPLPKEGLEAYLLNQEKALIVAALAQAGNNKTLAAKMLGMSFRSLRYRMKKLEIDEFGYD